MDKGIEKLKSIVDQMHNALEEMEPKVPELVVMFKWEGEYSSTMRAETCVDLEAALRARVKKLDGSIIHDSLDTSPAIVKIKRDVQLEVYNHTLRKSQVSVKYYPKHNTVVLTVNIESPAKEVLTLGLLDLNWKGNQPTDKDKTKIWEALKKSIDGVLKSYEFITDESGGLMLLKKVVQKTLDRSVKNIKRIESLNLTTMEWDRTKNSLLLKVWIRSQYEETASKRKEVRLTLTGVPAYLHMHLYNTIKEELTKLANSDYEVKIYGAPVTETVEKVLEEVGLADRFKWKVISHQDFSKEQDPKVVVELEVIEVPKPKVAVKVESLCCDARKEVALGLTDVLNTQKSDTSGKCLLLEAVKVVDDINERFKSRVSAEVGPIAILTYYANAMEIEVLGQLLWCESDDERIHYEYEDTDTYEPLHDYINRQIKENTFIYAALHADRIEGHVIGDTMEPEILPPFKLKNSVTVNAVDKENQEKRLLARLQSVLGSQLGINKKRVIPTASLREDLGADSLDEIECVMAIEEEFGINVPELEYNRWETVQNIFDYLKGEVYYV